MNLQQKLVLFDFLLYAAWLLVPAIIGKGKNSPLTLVKVRSRIVQHLD